MTARARLFAAFGAYLCLATHLVGVLHVLTVRHATCPGHGEMVHGEAPELHQAPIAAGHTARDATREPAEEPDEHCLMLATRRRELAALNPGHQIIPPAPAASALETPPAVAAAPPRTVLRFAPKTSPPAVA